MLVNCCDVRSFFDEEMNVFEICVFFVCFMNSSLLVDLLLNIESKKSISNKFHLNAWNAVVCEFMRCFDDSKLSRNLKN